MQRSDPCRKKKKVLPKEQNIQKYQRFEIKKCQVLTLFVQDKLDVMQNYRTWKEYEKHKRNNKK
jgi:hypothetical protein